jgi:hypothetical protein
MKILLPWTLLGALILLIVTYIKPLLISAIELYLSLLIGNDINITYLSLVESKASLHVGKETNKLDLVFLSYSPLLVDAKYDGDISAFKNYVPLSAKSKVDANISYDNNLDIDAKADIFNSKTTLKVSSKNDVYNFSAKIKQVDIKQFGKENGIKLDINDKADIELNGSFSDVLKAEVGIKFRDKLVKLSNIVYKDDALSLSTDYIGAPLHLRLEDNRLHYYTNNLDIQNVLKLLKQNKPIKGSVDINGRLNLKTMHNNLSMNSDKIQYNNTSLESLHVEAVATKEKSEFEFSLEFMDKLLEFDGELNYKEDVWLKLHSDNFDSDTSFVYKDDKFRLDSGHLSISRMQKAFKIYQDVDGIVDIEASGDFKTLDFKIFSKKIDIRNSVIKPFTLMLSGKYKKQKISFNPYLKNKNYVLSRGNNTYDLKTKKLKINQQLTLREKKGIVPILISASTTLKKPYRIKAVLKNKDNKGRVYVNTKNSTLHVELKDIDVTNIDNFIDKNNLFDKGLVNGKIVYEIKSQDAITNIVLSDAVLNGIDIDKQLSNLEDALGLNVVNIGKNLINNYKQTRKETYIEHLQLNTKIKNKVVYLEDVAASTKKFRIAAFGDIKTNGEINELEVSILDTHGCALITQDLQGTIQNPKAKSTSTAIVGVASAIPSALLSTGKKIINFGAKTIDGVASYAVDKTKMSDEKITITSRMVTKSGALLKNTSDIVLPNECKVVYDGLVKHPIQIEQKEN